MQNQLPNSDIIWTGIGSFALTIIFIVIGNLSIFFAWELEREVILFSLIAYIVCKWCGLDSRRIFDLGWQPKYDLPTGLKETYKWFTTNVESVRR